MKHPSPIAALCYELDRLTRSLALPIDLARAADVDGTSPDSPEHFQGRLFPVLCALCDVAIAASKALEPAVQDEMWRGVAADNWREHRPSMPEETA
jgi:hypothetical protein